MSEIPSLIESMTAHLAQTNFPDDPTATMPSATSKAGQPVLYVNGQYHHDMALYTAQVAPYAVLSPDGRSFYLYNNAPPQPSYPLHNDFHPVSAGVPDLHPLPSALGTNEGHLLPSDPIATGEAPPAAPHPCSCMYCTMLNFDLSSMPFYPASHADIPMETSASYTTPPLQTSIEPIDIPSQPTLYAGKDTIMPASIPLPLSPNPPLFPSHSYSGGGASSSTSDDADLGLDLGFDDLGSAKEVPYPFNPTPFAIAVNSYPVDCNYADVSGGSTTPTASSTSHDLPHNSLASLDTRQLFSSNPLRPYFTRSLSDSPTCGFFSEASPPLEEYQQPRRFSDPPEYTAGPVGRAPRGRKRKTLKPGEISEEWVSVEDGTERRKMQNKLAQRAFRARRKLQREQSDAAGSD